jgi:hypothetical protein
MFRLQKLNPIKNSSTSYTARKFITLLKAGVYWILHWCRCIQYTSAQNIPLICMYVDHLCGLVVRVLGYRSRGPGSIPGATRFSEGLERNPLSLVSTIEQLLERKSSGSGLENREYDRRDPSRWPRGTLYTQKLTLTLPASSGRSIGIVRSWTQTTEFVFFACIYAYLYCIFFGSRMVITAFVTTATGHCPWLI